ncbi:MAG: hypothetical protein H5U32_02860 [Pseudomonas balearica]|uniref:hypothetical protein n=1 Tax=Stutzerimonas balearica TaxID=74829 RepID=UPI0019B05122|nr:hypothetical protein [Stutzerimonas balearica]MBC7198169.1 hypothetical protein [Stutzerimonas balearica]
MQIQQVAETDAPAPVKRIDYSALAEHYNALEVGKTLKLDQVYNITLFRQALVRRGLGDEDVEVYQRKGNCFITRKTETLMA